MTNIWQVYSNNLESCFIKTLATRAGSTTSRLSLCSAAASQGVDEVGDAHTDCEQTDEGVGVGNGSGPLEIEAETRASCSRERALQYCSGGRALERGLGGAIEAQLENEVEEEDKIVSSNSRHAGTSFSINSKPSSQSHAFDI